MADKKYHAFQSGEGTEPATPGAKRTPIGAELAPVEVVQTPTEVVPAPVETAPTPAEAPLVLTGAEMTSVGTTRVSKPGGISLHGRWRFALDSADQGIDQEWYRRELDACIELPGSLQGQGYGDDVSTETEWIGTLHDPLWYLREEYRKYAVPENLKIPFLLQPDKHFVGVAWYQRTILIPDAWVGRRVVLTLERPHWETTVWLDDRRIGSANSLSVAHVYDLGMVQPGEHRVTVRVDNRMIIDVGWNAHSVTDYTQGNWNGIVGAIELSSTTPVWIEDVAVFPNVEKRTALLKIEIGNATSEPGKGVIAVAGRAISVDWGEDGGSAEVEVALGDAAELWDEFHPSLQSLTVSLRGDNADDERQVIFGLRQIAVEGTQFAINGRLTFFRGTHDGCAFPLTGYPPTDVESWRRIIRICQSYGLNHMRFHSWCPPEAAFVAADELGFYFQVECSLWARHKARIDPGSSVEQWLYEESARIVKAYGNHPSFVLMAYGNEPGGRWLECLPQWVRYWRERDPRRLYTAESGYALKGELGPVEDVQYLVIGRVGLNYVRGTTGWRGRDYRKVVENTNVPVIGHELGQYCAYPSFAEMEKYTGYLKPRNFEIFRESLEEHGMIDQAEDFLAASGRLQVLAYKEEIEACLRTPGYGGFQLLDLHDYPGQGTALVGVLDVFWESKGYTSPEEFRRFCSPTVLLARLTDRVYTSGDRLVAGIEVAHFGPEPLTDAVVSWGVTGKDGRLVAGGELPAQTIPIGNGTKLGEVSVPLDAVDAPGQFKLTVGLKGTDCENDWNFWVYPESDSADGGIAYDDILVTSDFDERTVDRLEAGGKVLLLPSTKLAWDSPPFAFAPIFWNRQMSPRWERSLGLLCDPEHPALSEFPTSCHIDWQWEGVIGPACRAVNMSSLPRELRPIVQPIDDWNRNHRLGLVFECRVGKGRLLVCSADLETALDERPAARQLLRSLIHYMSGDRFDPRVSVSFDQIRGLMFDTGVMKRLCIGVKADAEIEGGEASKLVDGDPDTAWQTPWRGDGVTPFPHEVTFEFRQPVSMAGVVCMQRQNSFTREGHIRDYIIQVSDDGDAWIEAARGQLESAYRPQRIAFERVVSGRYLRLIAQTGWDRRPTAALAELAVDCAGDMAAGEHKAAAKPRSYVTGRSATAEVDESTQL